MAPAAAGRPSWRRAGRGAGAWTALVALVGVATLAGTTHPVASAEAAPDRYLDPVFSDVTVTSDITYGEAVDSQGQLRSLELDLYEPAGDVATERPLIVWIHGGSFAYGSKAGDFDRQQGRELARRGFVVASIEYRLAPEPVTTQSMVTPEGMAAIVDAYEDGRTALAYLRQHAAEHRIDTDVVLASGYSAGGITALNLAVLTYPPIGTGVDGDPSHVDGAIAYAGASLASVVDPGEAPLLLFHGTSDPTVPYSMALAVHEAALADGLDSTMVAKPGATHDLSPYREELQERLGRWAYDRWLAPSPAIHGLSPRTVASGAESVVTVHGDALSPPGTSRVADDEVPTDAVDDEERRISVPALSPGFRIVSVTTATGGSTATLPSWLAVADPAVLARPAPFVDVGPDHPFAPGIGWARATTLTSGFPDGTFRPGAPVSRLAMAAFLHRLSGAPAGDDPTCTVAPFPDVPLDHPVCGEIAWARDAELLMGYADGTFRPDAPLSRQAMATTLHRAAGTPKASPSAPPTFLDVSVGHPSSQAVEWLAGRGLVTGYADGTFRPADPVSRQALLAVLHRHFTETPD